MKHTLALAAAIMLVSCGHGGAGSDGDATEKAPAPALDIASNADAVADYARREIQQVAPEMVKPGRTLNGRICAAAMAKVAGVAESAVQLESVDGNTTRLTVATSRRDCLVVGDLVVWREVAAKAAPTAWRESDHLHYRINGTGDIEIVTAA